MSTAPQPPNPHKHVLADFDSGSSISLPSLIACSGCGAVFKRDKIVGKRELQFPKFAQLEDLKTVTCPVCLATPGWEGAE